MKEQKIQSFVDEYRNFLSANHIDVVHSSITNAWFVYRYDPDYGYYDYFIKFSTLQQLIDIILAEMKFELYCAIEDEISSPDCDDNELADIIVNYHVRPDTISEFTKLLKYIIDSDLGKNSTFFKTLDSLSQKNI